MEERFNNIARNEKNKNRKSTIFGLCYGFVAITIMLLGILIALDVIPLYRYFVGIPLVVFSICMIIIELIILPKILKSENIEFQLKRSALEQELSSICNKASTLIRGKSNEKK